MKRILALLVCLAALLCMTACSGDETTTPSTSETEVAPIPGITDFSETASRGLEYAANADGISCTITGIGQCEDVYISVGTELDGLTVTAIGSSAFYGNKDIQGIRFPETVTSVGDYAFFECSSLEVLIFSEGMYSLGQYSFAGCGKLKSVTIPDSLEMVDSWAFYDCNGLEAVEVSDLERWCGISFGGPYANPLQCAKNLYVGDELLTELTLSDQLTCIGQWAFAGCTSLTRVMLHENVTNIYQRAFAQCENLTAIHFAGTIEQWSAVEKSAYWNFSIDELTIHCSDGEA